MLEIELKSKELKEYIYLELDKNRKDPIYDEDLEKISSIHLNKLDIVGDPTDETIYDLIFFPNLSECTISNMKISDQELEVLNKLQKLEFLQLNNCAFSGNKKVELNINGIAINKCNNVNLAIYDNIKTLQTLQIVNCNNINLKGISKFPKLSEIFLQNIEMDEIDELQNIKNLRYLNLNGSKIKNLDKINKLQNLTIEHEDINALYDGKI